MTLDLIHPDWDAPANVVAYTTLRNGGSSHPPYHSLNVGDHVGDDPQSVANNRALLPYHQKLHWLQQVHGKDCVELPSTRYQADAAISRTSQAFCAIMTADCVPILLCDQNGKEVAGIHAGWKGLELNIIAATVAKMHAPTHELLAWIGPAISVTHYEVSADLASRFSAWPGAVIAHQEATKAWLDLPKIAELQLQRCGVNTVTQSGLCTYANDHQFFSHRRAQHQNRLHTGRQVSVIGLI